ncbi:MAG TPA: hypothetical protein VH575_11440, partial [Gemmataceae bacterium]
MGAVFVTLSIGLRPLGQKYERASLVALALRGGATELSDLAYLHYRRNDVAGAATLYRAASAADHRTVYAPANLAIVLASLGRCEEAEEAAAEAEARSRRNGFHARDARLAARARFAVARCRIFSRNGRGAEGEDGADE